VNLPKPPGYLSPRLAQVIDLMGEGLTAKQIATRLFLTYGTVKNYMVQARERTGLTRGQVIAKRAASRECGPCFCYEAACAARDLLDAAIGNHAPGRVKPSAL